jgi:hypothetical protein
MSQAQAKKAAPWTGSKDNEEVGGATVTVCSKLPMDFILHLHRKVERHEPVMGGGSRPVVAYERRMDVKPVVINGCSHPQNRGPHCQIVGGYAMTTGVSKDFWDEWLSQNEQHDAVRNGMLFAQGDDASARDKANENAELKSNMERLDPKNLPKGLQTSEEMRKAA